MIFEMANAVIGQANARAEAMDDITAKRLEQEKIQWIDSFGKLELHDGDIVVLRSKMILSNDAHDNLQSSVRGSLKKLGLDNQVWILEENMDIGVISPR